MQNGDEIAAPLAENTKKPEVINKQYFRLKVWRHLESNGLAMFPRPVYNRIPNFKGAQEAAEKLAELDLFKNAVTVKVNPEKPQEPVRVLALEKQKTLYVPVPRLATGYLSRLELPEEENGVIKKAVSKNGMETFGKPVAIEESVMLDLVVMGSVAVSKEGYRIGKGRGYGDLEFGLMMHMKTIKPDTIVVTTVHDCQVFDTLPAALFGPHDVPIDLIVTPTQVIETQRMSQRPDGILWHLLSARRIGMMPILGQLRDIEMLAGRVCTLKEVDTDIEERGGSQRAGRRTRRRTRSHKSQSEGEGNTTEGEDGKPKPRRQQRRRNSHKSASKADKDGDGKEKKTEKRRNKRPRPVIEFSVKVSNISPNTRVRDLKQALSERGVKPQIMVWKGFRGFCYLHFLKPSPLKGEGDNAPAISIDSVLNSLAEMSVGGSGGGTGSEPEEKPRLLTVEIAPPRQPKGEEPRANSEVFDTLPAALFGPHDVPIDLIVTPTQVIETQRMSQRPDGILWHLLSARRIGMMPILGQLRDIEMLAGRVCTLKEVDTDIEERGGSQRAGRRTRRRTRSHKSQSEGEGNTTEGEDGKPKPRRQQRRRNSHKSASKADKDGDGKEKKTEKRRNKRPRPVIEFSVKVSNISPNTRVRDLKQALSERGVKPQIMVWKGFRGFCYLHFLKPSPLKGEGDNAPAISIDSVLNSLAEMSVGGSGGGTGSEPEEKPRLLTVEIAPPRQPKGEEPRANSEVPLVPVEN